MGESYRIDRTRRLWDDFYNAAGGGRGKVCTELLRPCRGVSLTYGAPTAAETGQGDGVLAPGDSFTLKVPVTNTGDTAGNVQVRADGHGAFLFKPDTGATGGTAIATGSTATFIIGCPNAAAHNGVLGGGSVVTDWQRSMAAITAETTP